MDVRVCPPPNQQHVHAFDEIAETLRYGFAALERRGDLIPNRTIVLGAHNLPRSLPADTKPNDIFYNFEQHGSPVLNNSVLHLFRQHEVWDYSPSNVAWFQERGVRAKHVPVGYVPELTRIKKYAQEIDVLFYGLVNDRRRKILDDLRAAGLGVYEANCYGPERDALISRSKVVLNMHFYETGIFEMVRCSYLFANEVCVVSEESVDVPAELLGSNGPLVTLVPYEMLVETCVGLIRAPDVERANRARYAHEAFRSCDETAILRTALGV